VNGLRAGRKGLIADAVVDAHAFGAKMLVEGMLVCGCASIAFGGVNHFLQGASYAFECLLRHTKAPTKSTLAPLAQNHDLFCRVEQVLIGPAPFNPLANRLRQKAVFATCLSQGHRPSIQQNANVSALGGNARMSACFGTALVQPP
jgi:hypothetical protein